MPSNATVATRWTMLPLLAGRVAENGIMGKNITRTKVAGGLCYKTLRAIAASGEDVDVFEKFAFRACRSRPDGDRRMRRRFGGDRGPRARHGPADLDRAGDWRPAE